MIFKDPVEKKTFYESHIREIKAIRILYYFYIEQMTYYKNVDISKIYPRRQIANKDMITTKL